MGDSENHIRTLSQDLARLRRRATRQKRDIQSSAAAWRRWSTSMDEIADLTQQLVASPTPDPPSLADKFGAIMWLIEGNESVLDTGDLRRLRRSGRELGRLASE